VGKPPPVCKKEGCGAPLIFARTANGSMMALDKQRDASQTSRYAVIHAADGRRYVRTLADGEQPARGEYRHMPHGATCAARKHAARPLERTDPN